MVPVKNRAPAQAQNQTLTATGLELEVMPAEPRDKKSESVPVKSSTRSSCLSLIQANVLVAMLAGFLARTSDGHPGPEVMGRGLIDLAGLVEYRKLSVAAARSNRSHSRRPRKPG